MLFNSYSFILAFLPVSLAVFFAVGARHHLAAAAWLTLASLFFYGWWDPRYVVLLLASIAWNFSIGRIIAQSTAPGIKTAVLATGIAANIGLLAYFKYANFFLHSINALFGSSIGLGEIILPLGISFFTFTQIAFLVDTYRGEAKEYNIVHYTLFVTYFPHLIAGPVLHHKEMMPQFNRPATYRLDAMNIAVGLTIFSIGLFKKTVLADGIAPYVAPVFAAAARGEQLTFFEAWGGALAYSVQLYFDFSGYSDMAIGLSRLFGIVLPLNFFSPYQAVNIIEFWRRWHMTLSRFLRDYLYVPLGGSRKGVPRRYANLGITMVLGGLWHGAGWTFVAWGALHGAYLVVNHGWRALRKQFGADLSRSTRIGRTSSRTLMLVAVVVGWVVFRAADLDAALSILKAMCGMNGVAIPSALMRSFESLGFDLQPFGVSTTLGSGTTFILTYLWVGLLWTCALFLPNTAQLMDRANPALDYLAFRTDGARHPWMPTLRWSLVSGTLFACSVLSLNRVSEFLYFQF